MQRKNNNISLSYRQAVGRYLPPEQSVTVIKQGGAAPSSFRKVFVRNIGADTALYSGQKLSRMTSAVQAFTLIELLVVVLIIGILAAVAVPQYQKAVEKSKATQAITMLKTAYDAAKNYQLATGEWPENFDELSVDIPWTEHTSLINLGHYRRPLSNKDWAIHIYKADNNNTGIMVMRLNGKYAGAGFTMRATCTYATMPLDQLLCQEEGAMSSNSPSDYCVKIFQGKQVPNISSGTQYYSVF